MTFEEFKEENVEPVRRFKINMSCVEVLKKIAYYIINHGMSGHLLDCGEFFLALEVKENAYTLYFITQKLTTSVKFTDTHVDEDDYYSFMNTYLEAVHD